MPASCAERSGYTRRSQSTWSRATSIAGGNCEGRDKTRHLESRMIWAVMCLPFPTAGRIDGGDDSSVFFPGVSSLDLPRRFPPAGVFFSPRGHPRMAHSASAHTPKLSMISTTHPARICRSSTAQAQTQLPRVAERVPPLVMVVRQRRKLRDQFGEPVLCAGQIVFGYLHGHACGRDFLLDHRPGARLGHRLRSRCHVDHGSTTSGFCRSRRKNSTSASPSHCSSILNPVPEARALTSLTSGGSSLPQGEMSTSTPPWYLVAPDRGTFSARIPISACSVTISRSARAPLSRLSLPKSLTHSCPGRHPRFGAGVVMS